MGYSLSQRSLDRLDGVDEKLSKTDDELRNLNISQIVFEKLIKIFIHGFLHLLGFNHEKNKDYKKMLKEEELIYQSVISKFN